MDFFKKKMFYTFNVGLNLQGMRETTSISFEACSEKKAIKLAENKMQKWISSGCVLEREGKSIYFPVHYIKSLELERTPKVEDI